MKISYNWLKELLPDLAAAPEEVAQLLTEHSFETVVDRKLTIDPKIITVRVEKLDKHPQADRLQLATVTDGKREVTVVCGAPNIKIGDIVPYAPVGATVWAENGQQLVVQEAAIRGVPSPGMLNSLRELGLGKWHAGLWILPPDTELGTSLVKLVGKDTVLEADITPNRGHDALCHIGIARELAALLKITIKEPEASPLPDAQDEVGGWTVELADVKHSPRYIGALFENVAPAPSPLWLQMRLLACGARPINNVVDISNYVMFEQGNPTHTFDAAKLPGNKMGARFAEHGERLQTLDGLERELNEATLIITSNDQPVAVAGVMGGASSEVDGQTNSIFLEVANFNPYTIQKTATQLGLTSEGSLRWTKGVDPHKAVPATQRMVELLREVAGAKLMGILDAYPHPAAPRVVSFNPAVVSKAVGIDIAPAESANILTRLRFDVKTATEPWPVTVPTDRLDIEGEHDLVEEVIRVHGLNNIPAQAPDLPVTAQPLPDELRWPEIWRDLLVGTGFTETYNYPFEDSALATPLGFGRLEHLTIVNPVAPELATMRVSLLPGLLKNVIHNQTEFSEQRLFELGRVFYPGVTEESRLAGVIVGETDGFRTVKGITEELFNRSGLFDVSFVQKDASPQSTPLALWAPGQVADAMIGSTEVGSVGVLSPQLQQQLKIKQPVYIFDLNAGALIKEASFERQFKPLPKYPPVYRDISFVIDAAISVERAKGVIETAGGELLRDVELFDIYEPGVEESPTTPSGLRGVNKSLAFHLRYESPDRTLTDEEVNQVQGKIIRALEDELGAQIRD